jgi:hypothetical protein
MHARFFGDRILTRILFMLLLATGFSAWGSAQAATTYYVRTDGGTAAECTGRADAAYPGTGTGQACAWKSLHYALPAASVPRILGGDTVIVGPGQYPIGWEAPGAAGGRCYAGGPYDCYLPPIPSGPSATEKTRILGKGYDTKCLAPPQLWGNERVSKVLNLEGSSNVEVGCLDITDHSDCVESHSDPAARCQRDVAPYGPWASVGVSANASSNVWLHDLNIHGLASRGIIAGGLNNWTLDRVKIIANGWAGWDGDIGTGSSNSGAITLRQVEIAWNGCGERWQTGTAWACWAQQAGGYGDGLGTAKTGGQWLIEDSFVHHNTSDGIDLLYLDGAASTSVVVRRVYAAGNAGNQIKTKGVATIENSIVIGNCAYFDGRDQMTFGDQCRAEGNALSMTLVAGQGAAVRHNTIIGQGDCLIITAGGTSTSRINIQNNALMGGLDYLANANGNTGERTCGHYGDTAAVQVSYAGNLFWTVKSDQCPAGSICGQDPKLTDMRMASFDANPLAGSPLIDKVPVLAGVTTDFLLQGRPAGAAADIGAIEYGGTASTTDPAPAPTPKPRGKKHIGADFNADGKADIVWRNGQSGADVLWMAGQAADTQTLAMVEDASWKMVGTGDFDGDGQSDLLWRNSSNGMNAIWKSGNAATRQAIPAVTNLAWKVAGVGDFDADGTSDILWRNPSTGANVVWRSGSAARSIAIAGVSNKAWAVAGIGDFNADGKSDVFWRNGATGANVIWNSGSASSQASVTAVNVAWAAAGVGDMDGDGKSDVLWRNRTTGANVIWKSADSRTQQVIARVADAAWTVAGLADFDGSGQFDILWRNTSTGANQIWMSAGSMQAAINVSTVWTVRT